MILRNLKAQAHIHESIFLASIELVDSFQILLVAFLAINFLDRNQQADFSAVCRSLTLHSLIFSARHFGEKSWGNRLLKYFIFSGEKEQLQGIGLNRWYIPGAPSLWLPSGDRPTNPYYASPSPTFLHLLSLFFQF